MWKNLLGKTKEPDPPIVALAQKPDLDEETAFTICQLINHVGFQIVDDWDWDFLERGRDDYRKLIDIRLLRKAWKVLAKKDWLSLQTTNDVDKRISTIAPLAGIVGLKSLVLQNNLIADLGPIAGMKNLKYLNILQNRISDVSLLRGLPELEEILLSYNPLTSLAVLEHLPKLRELHLTTNQISGFVECKSLAALRELEVDGDEAVESFKDWPGMPLLKTLKVHGMQRLDGIERFGSLETLGFYGGNFSDLVPLISLKRVTHIIICNRKPLDATPLSRVHTLRSLHINCPKVRGVARLSALPALHELHMDDEETCDADELEAARKDLAPWDEQFKDNGRGLTPSLTLEIVDQDTFDYYDSKAPYGMGADECDTGMLNSERRWLLGEIGEALSAILEEDTDFHLPWTSGAQRSERVILYTAKACESFREIVLALQRVLCATKNDWIIWTQALPSEGSDETDFEDFVVWVYPQKVVATKEHEKIVGDLIEWRSGEK